jgi:hypothetical protein
MREKKEKKRKRDDAEGNCFIRVFQGWLIIYMRNELASGTAQSPR